MQHLQRPDENRIGPTIRLLCDPNSPPTSPTRNTSFHTYLKHKGWEIRKNGVLRSRSSIDGRDPDDPDEENSRNQFAQKWLFFKLLKEVLGDLDGFSFDEFITQDSDRRDIVTTARLPHFLGLWQASEKRNTNGRSYRLARVQHVLEEARFFVSHYCSVMEHGKNSKWGILPEFSLSFMVLGETLTRAHMKIQQNIGFTLRGWSNQDYPGQGWGYSRWVLDDLHEDNWCTKTISMLQALLRDNTIGLLYLNGLRIPSKAHKPRKEHDLCTSQECKHEDVEDAKHYKQYHHFSPIEDREEHKTTCESIGPVAGRIAEVVKKGHIPLLKYTKKTRQLDVVELEPNAKKEYAIFSHVWADGFGNPGTNKLNSCVLDLFLKIFEEIKLERNQARATELFWIDTLAIPVGIQYVDERTQAIGQMHDIYTKASYTIVLDGSLMRLEKGDGYAAPAMKVTICGWMTRLWTLQEALLSQDIYFNFSDKPYRMDRMEKLFQDEDESLCSCIPAVARTYYHRILGLQDRATFVPNASFVGTVWKAAQWRTTAWKIHETLSLATLLKIDTSPFADSSNSTTETLTPQQLADDLERRMCTFLSLLSTQVPCAIPAGIIFVPGPKLARTGYGWAPTTWLTSKAVESPDPLSIVTQRTVLRKCGLEVQFPGYQLHGPVSHKGVSNSTKELRFSVDPSLLKWYKVESTAETQVNRLKLEYDNVAIIMARVPVISAKEIALLVTVIENQGTIWHVNVISRVWISHENDHQKLEEARTDILCNISNRLNTPGTSFIGEDIPPDLQWCVHGPCTKPNDSIVQTIPKAKTMKIEPTPKMLNRRARTSTNLNPLNWFGSKA
ncbi:hypothetical protein MMC17_009695 [Xylographa soralifera]|nr:hypothetical protein [Xylographa soralifera]